MEMPIGRALVWFRRDLRTDDHAALHHALRQSRQVFCGFVFDRSLLDPLPRRDRRVEFIRDSLAELDAGLRALGAAHGLNHTGLIVRHGLPAQEIPLLATALQVQAVFASHDDDPAALARDARVRGELAAAGVLLVTCRDHVVFERSELLTAGGSPYAVFTPYRKAWLGQVDDARLQALPVGPLAERLADLPPSLRGEVPTLAGIGFETTGDASRLPGGSAAAKRRFDDFIARIDRYADSRDFPAVKGPSYLGTDLRFGTLSIRLAARTAWQRAKAGSRGADIWLSELIWRDFYHQILHHHPRVATHAFKPAFDAIVWAHGREADRLFQAWCDGRTGYPIVDAAMAQINQTGYMHNRLRMISASFLVKDLGLDWRRGEAYFARHLNDFDLAANNGGWQWSASTGCDAQPYFRIFNPVSQSRRFDPDGRFIRRYLPVLARLPDDLIHAPWLARPVDLAAAGIQIGVDYPAPVVDHAAARQETLARFAAARGRQNGG
jgi:deoxyribodipyrimidine photo-lyase